MEIRMFNFWYFFWIALSLGVFFGLYFLLRKRSDKTKKTVLFFILAFALLLHFLKFYIPPYSTDISRLYRDAWFINICAANILLFPFLFLLKNETVKDYMFYIGTFSGILATVLPLEPIQKLDQSAEILDIIRFYIHHSILWIVPLLMVVLGLHKIKYRRVVRLPFLFLGLLLFIMLNQIFQSELGFVPLRGDGFFEIGYKNTSYIWGPDDTPISKILLALCPDFFKTVPVGAHAGEYKAWPWFWLIFPSFILLIPLAFLVSLFFDYESLRDDVIRVYNKLRTFFLGKSE